MTYCVTIIGYQYVSGWCLRQHHCVTDHAGSANQPTFHCHHTCQPAISDHLTPTGWMNWTAGLLSVNDALVTTWHASGILFQRLSDPLTVTTPAKHWTLICLTLSDVEEYSVTDPCPWFWIFIYRNGHLKILWLIERQTSLVQCSLCRQVNCISV